MKIVVGGQLVKNEIADEIKKINNNIEVEIMSDLDAAMAVQNGSADYYFGACDTGGGGALAMAISFLGVQKAVTIATQASKKSESEIADLVKSGYVAFGFFEGDHKYCVKHLLKYIK